MAQKPLSVAIAAVTAENKILLIKRERGDYQGLWGMPGGKIELDEHVHDAVEREIQEETGVETTFKRHCGVVSEHLVENDAVDNHFLLHICELDAENMEVSTSDEGCVEWFDLGDLETLKAKLIPSDYRMVKHFIAEQKTGYAKCVIEKNGSEHVLKTFEPV